MGDILLSSYIAKNRNGANFTDAELKALKEGEDILQEINNGKRKGYNNMEDLIKSLNEE